MSSLKSYLDSHLTVYTYHCVYSKCGDDSCMCGQPKLPPSLFKEVREKGFPLPVEDPDRKGHYAPFKSVYGIQESQKEALPSVLARHGAAAQSGNLNQLAKAPTHQAKLSFQRNYVRDAIPCTAPGCNKFRAIFCQTVGSFDQLVAFVEEAKEHAAFTCGSPLFDINGDMLFQKKLTKVSNDGGKTPIVYVRERMKCHMPIEWPLYGALKENRRGRANDATGGPLPCCHCATRKRYLYHLSHVITVLSLDSLSIK